MFEQEVNTYWKTVVDTIQDGVQESFYGMGIAFWVLTRASTMHYLQINA